jgi:hypothetical protein
MWWLIDSFEFLLGYLLRAFLAPFLSRFGPDGGGAGAGERNVRGRARATTVTP